MDFPQPYGKTVLCQSEAGIRLILFAARASTHIAPAFLLAGRVQVFAMNRHHGVTKLCLDYAVSRSRLRERVWLLEQVHHRIKFVAPESNAELLLSLLAHCRHLVCGRRNVSWDCGSAVSLARRPRCQIKRHEWHRCPRMVGVLRRAVSGWVRE